MAKYHQLIDGEWAAVPKRGHKNQCCHCALVHRFDYRVNAAGQLEIRARVDRRATAAARRAFEFTPEEQ